MVLARDWHPLEHVSFSAQGGPWPPHCVAGTPGAAFAPGLLLPERAEVVSKAALSHADAYSGFEGTALAAGLRARRLFVGGLATGYCVQATVLDAVREGFDVVLLGDAIRAVEVTPGDGERAECAMQEAGASVESLGDLTAPPA